jgi:hypothetical protein
MGMKQTRDLFYIWILRYMRKMFAYICRFSENFLEKKYRRSYIMVDGTEFYNTNFYNKQWEGSLNSAKIILPLVLKILPKTNSAVDFGCGRGTWLSVLKDLGVKDIKGYDGAWVDKESLLIPKESFEAVELDKKIPLNRKYDFAMSVEVAEHLPEQSAKIFVETLTRSSDIVLFSAAIPFQGGMNHINEQWQYYWYTLFNEFGYIGIDYIRNMVWNDTKIELYYGQNILLYIKKEMLKEINISEEYYKTSENQLNIVHPGLYIGKMTHMTHMMTQIDAYSIPLIRLYKIGIKRTIKKLLGERILKLLKKLLKHKKRR